LYAGFGFGNETEGLQNKVSSTPWRLGIGWEYGFIMCCKECLGCDCAVAPNDVFITGPSTIYSHTDYAATQERSFGYTPSNNLQTYHHGTHTETPMVSLTELANGYLFISRKQCPPFEHISMTEDWPVFWGGPRLSPAPSFNYEHPVIHGNRPLQVETVDMHARVIWNNVSDYIGPWNVGVVQLMKAGSYSYFEYMTDTGLVAENVFQLSENKYDMYDQSNTVDVVNPRQDLPISSFVYNRSPPTPLYQCFLDRNHMLWPILMHQQELTYETFLFGKYLVPSTLGRVGYAPVSSAKWVYNISVYYKDSHHGVFVLDHASMDVSTSVQPMPTPIWNGRLQDVLQKVGTTTLANGTQCYCAQGIYGCMSKRVHRT